MLFNRGPLYSPLRSLGLSALFTALALMVTNPVMAQESTEHLFNLSLEELLNLRIRVMTGTTGKDMSILKSSLAVTVIEEEELARQAPFGFADALQPLPGFYVQNSGGNTSNNIGVRGLPATQHFEFISVHEDGLPVNYERYTTDAIQRYDMGIHKIEATRGGPSGVLTPNGAAAIVNVISKSGNKQEGTVKLTQSDYKNKRADLYFGTPLYNHWLMALSGYYHSGDTPRETGFDAEKGGQFKAKLTRLFSGGEVAFSYKHLDESNAFYLPLPIQRGENGNLKEISGFDLAHGNTTNVNNSVVPILFSDGHQLQADATRGAEVTLDSYTFNVKLELTDNWQFNHGSRVVDFLRDFNGIWTGSAGSISIMDASEYLEDDIDFGGGYGTVGDFFANNPGDKRCLQFVNSGELICQGSTALDGIGNNGLLQILNALNEPIKREQIISDSRFTYQTDNNSFSFGLLYFKIDHQRALQTSLFLSEVNSNNAQLMDIVAVDENNNVKAYLSDNGVVKHGQWRGNDDMQVSSYSVYLNDEFQVNDNLRIDGGLRFEQAEYKATSLLGVGDRVQVTGALDENGQDIDNVLANNYATPLLGNGDVTKHTSTYREVAKTIGFNYLLTEDVAMYGRFAQGFQTPRADRISDIVISGIDTPASNIEFSELGIRYQGQTFNLSTTLSYTHFDNYLTGGVGFDNTGSEILNEAQVEVSGIEFEWAWIPLHWLSIEAMGVFQDAKLHGLTNPVIKHWAGNQPARMPNRQISITPTFQLNHAFQMHLSYRYLGTRYGANDNIVEFPTCELISAGANYDITGSFSVEIKGKNITDEICYTEGNPRATSDENSLSYGYARPIVGATWLASLIYQF